MVGVEAFKIKIEYIDSIMFLFLFCEKKPRNKDIKNSETLE